MQASAHVRHRVTYGACTGKTTLMLQRMREALPDPTRALYVSLDHLWFAGRSLYDVAEYHYSHGGTHLFIDEIHYQRDWQQLLKNLYDDFPELSIVYTGSSLLKLETDRNQGLKMLGVLDRAELLGLFPAKAETLKNISRPAKIYCDNPNIMAALVPSPNVGCMREAFFLNQLRAVGHDLAYPPAGDFLVDGKTLFEVGGKRKSFEQIKGIPDSYLAVDGIEADYGNRIPLWMFGLLY